MYPNNLKNVLKFISPGKHQFASKWLILAIDLFIVAILISIMAIYHPVEELHFSFLFIIFPIVGYVISQLITGLYTVIVRKMAITDLHRVFKTVLYGWLLTTFLFVIIRGNFQIHNLIQFALHAAIVVSLWIGWRVLVRELLSDAKQIGNRPNFWIYGAGTAGQLTYNALHPHANLLGFIDDNPSVLGKFINGLKVFNLENAAQRINNSRIENQIIISIQNISVAEKTAVVERCLNYNLNVKVVPAIENWIHGELTVGQIKPINIEDLLGRDVINLDNVNIEKEIVGKTILVTGAAGSIGSELVHQVAHYKPKRIILVDQAETPMFDLEQTLLHDPEISGVEFKFIICSVINITEIKTIFRNDNVQIVFHAAAYKHVPLMEGNPNAAIEINIFGTALLADLADQFNVEKFLLVSTDKAVNPTNVMGATKRAAEIYVQSKNRVSKTAFITTRFGNVLGSNGSVIPQFKKQIDAGGPVKVTHPDITRFFMTIPEACQLVLEAGAMGMGGEVFVFDMGKPVRIVDLAKRMILLSGLELDEDIEIIYTGLRPGEKLFEELLNDSEITLATHHAKILKAKVNEYPFDEVSNTFLSLKTLLSNGTDVTELILILKQLIPEYVSQNSVYELLDTSIEN